MHWKCCGEKVRSGTSEATSTLLGVLRTLIEGLFSVWILVDSFSPVLVFVDGLIVRVRIPDEVGSPPMHTFPMFLRKVVSSDLYPAQFFIPVALVPLRAHIPFSPILCQSRIPCESHFSCRYAAATGLFPSVTQGARCVTSFQLTTGATFRCGSWHLQLAAEFPF